jgi:hypothetical protein
MSMLCKHQDTKVQTLFILFYYIPYVFARIMEKDVHKVDRRLKFDLREPPNLSYLPPAVSANFTEQALHGLLGMLVQTGTPSQAYELIRTQHFQ